MKSSKRQALNAAALTTLAVIGIQSAHAADAIISASLQLSGLSFQLIDLDLNDGITPSFSLGPSGEVIIGERVKGNYEGSGPLPITLGYGTNTTTPFNYTTPAGRSTLSVGTNGLSSTSSLTANDASRTVSGPYVYTYTDSTGSFQSTTTYNDNWASARADLTVNRYLTSSKYDPVTSRWVNSFDGNLSANTLLVITGQVSQNATIDRSAVLSAMGPEINRYSSARTTSSLEVSLGAATPGYEGFFRIWSDDSVDGGGGLSRSSFKSTLGLTYHPDSSPDAVTNLATQALITDKLAQSNQNETFTLVASNTSDRSAGMSLMLRAYTDAEIFNRLVTETVIPIDPSLVIPPSIPEPSTCALMGLGLVGIAQVARRRKANA